MIRSYTKLKTSVMLLCSAGAIASSEEAFAQQWVTRAPMLTGHYFPATVADQGLIYAFGGCPNGLCNESVSADVEAYNPATDRWTVRSPMPTARGGIAAAGIHGVAYVLGGAGLSQVGLPTVEAYDIATDSWTARAPMSTPRVGPAAVTLGDRIYVVGGSDGSRTPSTMGALSSMEAYDPLSNTWIPRAPMPTARAYPGYGVIGGRLFVVGGLDGNRKALGTVEVYDPISNTWVTRSSLPTANVSPGAAVIGDKLYIVGGSNYSYFYSSYQVFNGVEIYDPASDGWTAGPSLSIPREGPGAVASHGSIYFVGGGHQSGEAASLEVLTVSTCGN